jgi:hypothetical protein
MKNHGFSKHWTKSADFFQALEKNRGQRSEARGQFSKPWKNPPDSFQALAAKLPVSQTWLENLTAEHPRFPTLGDLGRAISRLHHVLRRFFTTDHTEDTDGRSGQPINSGFHPCDPCNPWLSFALVAARRTVSWRFPFVVFRGRSG